MRHARTRGGADATVLADPAGPCAKTTMIYSARTQINGGSIIGVQDISRAAKPILEAYGFQGATLFGSFADGTASEHSDIDLFVQVPAGTKTKSIFAFAYDLGETLGRDVDAYGSHEVHEGSDFHRSIMAGGIALWA